MRTFALYPEAQHWWSFTDYGAVVDVVQHLGARRVLEFGPGSSTLALIEGGATSIDTLEDDPHWAGVHEARLAARYPAIVRVHRYVWRDPLTIAPIDAARYDLALIDGPRGTDRRPAVVQYCLDRCAAVLLPTEDGNPTLRPVLQMLAAARGLQLEIRETGPLAGAFALITRAPC